MSLELVLSVIGGLVAVATFVYTSVRGVAEYRRQGAQKRFEHYLEIGNRMWGDPNVKRINDLLEPSQDPEMSAKKKTGLREVPFAHKREYLSYHEEVALMMNSGLLSKHLAHFMCGYNALLCYRTGHDPFWNNVNKESPWWGIFRDFVLELEKLERSGKVLPRHLKDYDF